MSRLDRAMRIQSTMSTPGWEDIRSIFMEHVQLPKDELFEIMSKRPEALTGKGAVMRASKAKAIEELLEEIEDQPKLLIQTQNLSGSLDVKSMAA